MIGIKNLHSVAIVFVLIFGVAACDNPPSAEKVGREIDQAAEKANDRLDNATEKLSEKTEKASAEVEDSVITTKIKAAILAEPGLKSLDINVDTVKGKVTLTGTVDSQQNSDRAKQLAGNISGVNEVENQLSIKSN